MAVTLLAGLAFANAVANGFVLDDKGIIVHNPLVTTGQGVWAAFAIRTGPSRSAAASTVRWVWPRSPSTG